MRNNIRRIVLAVLGVALLGATVFVILLPWADSCSFRHPPNVNCLHSPLRENVANVLFVVICVAIGGVASLLAGSFRYTVAVAAALLAFIGAHFASAWVYGVEVSEGEFLSALRTLSIPAVLGLVGGYLSRYVSRSA